MEYPILTSEPEFGVNGKTFVCFPTINLVSSKEEFRALSVHLSNKGHRVQTVEWPGLTSETQVNFSVREVPKKSLVALYCDFVAQVLATLSNQHKSIVVVGAGHASVFILRALRAMQTNRFEKVEIDVDSDGEEFPPDVAELLPPPSPKFENIQSVILCSPTWRSMLRRKYPHHAKARLARRQSMYCAFVEKCFSGYDPFTMHARHRIWLSEKKMRKWLSVMYDSPDTVSALVEGNTASARDLKFNAFKRTRPIEVDSRIEAGLFDPVTNPAEFIAEFAQGTRPVVPKPAETEDAKAQAERARNDDDEDDLLFNFTGSSQLIKSKNEGDPSVEEVGTSLPILVLYTERSPQYAWDDMKPIVDTFLDAEKSPNKDCLVRPAPGGILAHEEFPQIMLNEFEDFLYLGKRA